MAKSQLTWRLINRLWFGNREVNAHWSRLNEANQVCLELQWLSGISNQGEKNLL